MSLFDNNTQGYITQSGVSNVYLVEAGPETSRNLHDVLPDEKVGFFYITSASGYQLMEAQWDAGARTLTGLRVLNSSNGNAWVNWGEGQKLVSEVVPAEEMNRMVQAASHLKAGDTYALLVTGQSGPMGVAPAPGIMMPINPNVTDWQTPDNQAPAAATPAGYSLVVADPDRDPNLSQANTTAVGMIGSLTRFFPENNGQYVPGFPTANVGWFAAHIFNLLTGIKVAMLQVCKNGANDSHWEDGGEVDLLLHAHAPVMLAQLGKTHFDGHLYWQGESNVFTDPELFATKFRDYMDRAEGVFLKKWVTHTVICDLLPNLQDRWDGIKWAADATSAYTSYIDTSETEHIGDGLHMTWESQYYIVAQTLARYMISGPSVTQKAPRDIVRLRWAKGAESEVEDDDDAIGFYHRLKNAFTRVGQWIAQWETHDATVKVGWRSDGMPHNAAVQPVNNTLWSGIEWFFNNARTNFGFVSKMQIRAEAALLHLRSAQDSSAQDVQVFTETKGSDNMVPNDVTYGAQSAHPDATGANANGGATTVKGGDGAANEEGDGGDLVLAGGAAGNTGSRGVTRISDAIYGVMVALNNATSESVAAGLPQPVEAFSSVNMANGVIVDLVNHRFEVLRAGRYKVTATGVLTGTPSTSVLLWLYTASGFPYTQPLPVKLDAAGVGEPFSQVGYVELDPGEWTALGKSSNDGATSATFQGVQLSIEWVSNKP